jgi:hypothetical protein
MGRAQRKPPYSTANWQQPAAAPIHINFNSASPLQISRRII